MPSTFQGWSPAVFEFYDELELNNNKAFWTEHKAIYDDEVREPFDALNEVISDEFGELKVFRPYRDVRFSKDKTPYKTRCYGVAGGDGGQAYYLEVSASGVVVATGFWMMANDQLARYREAVDDDKTGTALEKTVAALRKKRFEIEGHGLKTAPRGYPRDHPRVELLRYKSLAGLKRFDPDTTWLHTKGAAKRITDTWRAAQPLNDWLTKHVGPSTEPPRNRWS